MIFCGDISLPYGGAVRLADIPSRLLEQRWVGNLEGSLTEASHEGACGLLDRHKVFNSFPAVRGLCRQIPFAAFSLANNHITDAAPLSETMRRVGSLGIGSFGAGRTAEECARGFEIRERDAAYVIFGYGWDGIGCKYAAENKEGVNPYTAANVLGQMRRAVAGYPGRRVICFMHWNYELESYPHPLDREIAHELIDAGVHAVIGCHSHRTQPVEVYKGHPIAYGLGNFMFRSGAYMKGRLVFPGYANEEYLLEINGGGFRAHLLNYDPERHVVSYAGEAGLSDPEFAALTDGQYRRWFKENRRLRRKLLPVFYRSDSRWEYSCKLRLVKIRNRLTGVLSRQRTAYNLLRTIVYKTAAACGKRGGAGR